MAPAYTIPDRCGCWNKCDCYVSSSRSRIIETPPLFQEEIIEWNNLMKRFEDENPINRLFRSEEENRDRLESWVFGTYCNTFTNIRKDLDLLNIQYHKKGGTKRIITRLTKIGFLK